jgi:hypothetical protein
MPILLPNLVTCHVYGGRVLPRFDAQAYQYILAGDGIFVRAETPAVPGGRMAT